MPGSVWSRLGPARLGGRAPASPWYAGQRLRRDSWMPAEPFQSQTDPALKRLLLLHSPKTGGSSLRTMYAAHVPRERTFLATGRHQWIAQSPQDTRDIELFVGHQFLEPLYRHPDDTWITVLPVREPLSWWKSWYKWRRGLLRDAGNYTDPISVLSMQEWLDGRHDGELANPQASWLLARTRIMFDSVAAVPGRMSALGGALWDSPGPAVDVLERLVDAVDVVGPTERLHGIYLRTCTAMGWEPAFEEAVRENTSQTSEGLLDLRPEQVQRLLGLNRIDVWLHRRSQELATRP